MKKNHDLGRRGSFLWLSVGAGKTLIVLSYLRWLLKENQLPKYVVYTLPSSAVASVTREIEAFGMNCQLLVPLKTLGKAYHGPDGKVKKNITRGCMPSLYSINLIEHDHLRRCEEELPRYMPESIFIIDEVHKALNDTKRTSIALQLSHLSREFIALTGTPIIDTHTYKLIWWLEQIVPFEVNEKNFWVAANGMIAKRFETGKEIVREEVEAEMTEKENEKYRKLVGPALGGVNSQPRYEDLREAMRICYNTCDRKLISETYRMLSSKHRVFLVAKDVEHQKTLHEELLDYTHISEEGKTFRLRKKDIFLISSGESIFLTQETVSSGQTLPYRVVITTIRHVEGYTLTYMDTMITGVYPSNNATREQLEGRINRIGQTSETLYYITVHCGILTYIFQHHRDSRNLSAVLSTLAEGILV
jgi:superfamily II DNA or RNA helicase